MNAVPSKRELSRYNVARDAILDIVSSPRVKEFCVGITAKPTQRRSAYRYWCTKNKGNLSGFVVLDCSLTSDQAQRFEEWLFGKLKTHHKHANRKYVRYFPNVNRRSESQFIYVAWWRPAFCRDGDHKP